MDKDPENGLHGQNPIAQTSRIKTQETDFKDKDPETDHKEKDPWTWTRTRTKTKTHTQKMEE